MQFRFLSCSIFSAIHGESRRSVGVVKREIGKNYKYRNHKWDYFDCLFFMQIPVPKMICSLSAGLSNLTGPLSMLVIGISIAAMELKDLFTDVKLLKFALIKLLAVPVAAMLLVCQVIDNRLICEVFLVMMATPAASMCAMLSQQYGGDYELAAKGVALTTILSVVTMPIVSEIVFHIAV